MLIIPAGQHDIIQVHFSLCSHVQRIVKMNKTDDDELGDEELSDEEIKALSEGLHLNCIFDGLILFQSQEKNKPYGSPVPVLNQFVFNIDRSRALKASVSSVDQCP